MPYAHSSEAPLAREVERRRWGRSVGRRLRSWAASEGASSTWKTEARSALTGQDCSGLIRTHQGIRGTLDTERWFRGAKKQGLEPELVRHHGPAHAQRGLKHAHRLLYCGHLEDLVHGCEDGCGVFRRSHTCKDSLCPTCSTARRRKYLALHGDALTWSHSRSGQPLGRMLTLTQLGQDGESARDARARLLKQFRTLWRLLPEGKGALRSFELVPKGSRRWHAHFHVLLAPAGLEDLRAWDGTGPIDPWQLRALWATASIDRRTRAGRDKAEALQRFCNRGSRVWLKKVSAGPKTVRRLARQLEVWLLHRWSALCRSMGIGTAVIDVRAAPLAQALKYVCKGITDTYRATSWHLRDLVESVHGMRRIEALGCLRGVDDDDEGEEERPTVACPCCGGESSPQVSHELDRAPPDWVLRAHVEGACQTPDHISDFYVRIRSCPAIGPPVAA